MKEADYIAIKRNGDDFYTWYDRSYFATEPLPPLTDEQKKTVCEVTYEASGELIQREDGEFAEIWIPLKCPND